VVVVEMVLQVLMKTVVVEVLVVIELLDMGLLHYKDLL
jgi:hypothetical protein